MTSNSEALGEAESNLNQLGQRIGRKGRDTRERIIAATQQLLANPERPQITLSAVARTAAVGMTSIYSYFRDLSELLAAVLEPVMAATEDAYMAPIRTHWSDEDLAVHCRRFIDDYYSFWVEHARILHLRNAFADAGDERLRALRVNSNITLFELLMDQIEAPSHDWTTIEFSMVMVIETGIERMMTVLTDPEPVAAALDRSAPGWEARTQRALEAQAWLLEVTLRAARHRAREARNAGIGSEAGE